MNNSKFAVGIQKGDLIVVNYPSGMSAAIYAGEGEPELFEYNY